MPTQLTRSGPPTDVCIILVTAVVVPKTGLLPRPAVATGASATAAGVDLASLVQQTAGGDQEAFTAVYDATAGRAFGLALRVLRNPALAEEVAQEAYLQVWMHSARYNPARGSAISWILMIVHRRAVSRVRSSEARVRRETNFQRQETLTQPTSKDSTHDAASASMEARRVRDALAELSPAQREAVELAYFGGYTYSEVAGLSGIPLGTAKTRIRSGLLKLHDLLGDR